MKISERLLLRDYVLSQIDFSVGCFVAQKYNNATVKQLLGNGEEAMVYNSCVDLDNNCIPNTQFALKVVEKISETEHDVLLKCNQLLENNICQNVPLTYYISSCNSCYMINSKQCNVIANELATSDLNSWFKTKRTKKEINSMVFQVCAGIYTLFKLIRVSHNDLHFGNILVHKCQKGGYWKYTIDDKNYYIENCGFIFTLWDFTKSIHSSECVDHVRLLKILTLKKYIQPINYITIHDIFSIIASNSHQTHIEQFNI